MSPSPDPGLWFVPEGHGEPLWSTCSIVLEDGTDIGPRDRLPSDLPVGYHTLLPVDGGSASTVVVFPERCPPAPSAWGLAVQVYALWSAGSWGVGDLGDVAVLGAEAAAHGAEVMLLSPLHAPAPITHQENSPYSPSSRCWWNPLLLPIDEPPPTGLVPAPERLIDRDAAWAARRTALWQRFEARARSTRVAGVGGGQRARARPVRGMRGARRAPRCTVAGVAGGAALAVAGGARRGA